MQIIQIICGIVLMTTNLILLRFLIIELIRDYIYSKNVKTEVKREKYLKQLKKDIEQIYKVK